MSNNKKSPLFSRPFQDQFLIDLHIHTDRYSPCAPTVDPCRIRETLDQKNFHGGVLSEHDALWSYEELATLEKQQGGAKLYRGVEISSANGHVLAIGLENLSDLPVGVGLKRLIAIAREQQAALIWVHPYLHYRGLPFPQDDTLTTLGIHAVEVVSSVTRGQHACQAMEMAANKGWAQVGGSDAHAQETIGMAGTLFPKLPEDEKELAQLIITRQCSAHSAHYFQAREVQCKTCS